MGTAIEHPVPDRVKPSLEIFDMRQSARMSKITNDGLTRSGTGCSIAVPIHMATVDVKGLTTTGLEQIKLIWGFELKPFLRHMSSTARLNEIF